MASRGPITMMPVRTRIVTMWPVIIREVKYWHFVYWINLCWIGWIVTWLLVSWLLITRLLIGRWLRASYIYYYLVAYLPINRDEQSVLSNCICIESDQIGAGEEVVVIADRFAIRIYFV